MKKIELTQGRVALVSDCDYKYLMQWKWCYHKEHYGGYAKRKSQEDKVVFMHQAVAARQRIVGKADHKNQDKLDCRRCNLRPATSSQNRGNIGLYASNKSGYTGVNDRKKRRTREARIGFNGKEVFLGMFPYTGNGKIQAAYAYDVAALKLFKKHACINSVSHLLYTQTKKQIKQDVLQRLRRHGL